MEWSAKYATNAYLDALKLCGKHRENCNPGECQKEPESTEFISALAAGMRAQLMVEVASEVSPATVALAAAARQTGGKLVCILPEVKENKSQQLIEESGLNDMVEFETGDPVDVLHNYENIDFSLIDCTSDNYKKLLDQLDVNPRRSVVVANNLVEGCKGLEGHLRGVEKEAKVRSIKYPIGKGMEITLIGKFSDHNKREKGRGSLSRAEKKGGIVKKTDKSKWIVKVDEKSGEENFYRLSPR
ncbi:uncharacterized protein [Coffea arabica]|uniref:S-adenosyl-L-methionine-dependent methyltransferase n=1 Tax=Coffea arabica TaxID=13443 RepID=A0A6P6W469_COFAR